MDAQTDIEAVLAWQAAGYVHPLTCRYCEEREVLLYPEADGEDVVLVCPTCDGRQVMHDRLREIVRGLPPKPEWVES